MHLYRNKVLADMLISPMNKQNKNFKVWLRQGSKVETTKHTGVKPLSQIKPLSQSVRENEATAIQSYNSLVAVYICETVSKRQERLANKKGRTRKLYAKGARGI
jgi:hypothetical protein